MGVLQPAFYTLLLLLGGSVTILGLLILLFRKIADPQYVGALPARFSLFHLSVLITLLGGALIVVAAFKSSIMGSQLTASLHPKGETPLPALSGKKIQAAANNKVTAPFNSGRAAKGRTTTLPDSLKNDLAGIYSQSALLFCAKLDADGAGYDFSHRFLLETQPDYIYFLLNNQGIAFATSKIVFYIYKKAAAGYQLQYTLPVFIPPLSTYLYQQVFFNEPGTYQVKARDADGRYITAGTFTLVPS